ncbi:molybdopterin converting factor, subunit 1 [Thiorhodococcus drewsii AZ1]|uniref:Molybdopterin converting factor, subunit 1 n=1 Tax=Thiorhodococcus drewsii AZ1 TaxID=765913 RepID=G2DYH8_9GAMM|nr:molybdopterin converting factor subunit 1 [Thiorhodococcus drewsii]EGV32605.1 molybdopterin converting factor, subunit 1 [Thiorhodococcus drewsii AZ1]
MLRIFYFASLRERLQTEGESLVRPDSVFTVEQLRDHLHNRGGVWSETLGSEASLLYAVNQELVRPDAKLGDDDEVAFLPPVTGG